MRPTGTDRVTGDGTSHAIQPTVGEDEAHFKTRLGDLSPLTFERQWAAAATILPLAADRGMAVMMDAATRRRIEEFIDTL